MAHTHHEHDHHHGHAHQHGHSHGHHHHAPADFNRAFAIGISLNVLFVLIEAFYGWKINSLALLADAGHNLSDVAGLVLAWAGAWAERIQPDARHSYGFKRASILAAFINSLVLLVAMGSLAWEAVHRLQSPQPIEGVTSEAVVRLAREAGHADITYIPVDYAVTEPNKHDDLTCGFTLTYWVTNVRIDQVIAKTGMFQLAAAGAAAHARRRASQPAHSAPIVPSAR